MWEQALTAVLKLGIPVAILATFLLRQMYRKGTLDPTENTKAVDERIKTLRKEKDPSVKTNLVQSKWMQFGGGFYGLAALWTFIVIELEQLIQFLSSFPGFAELTKNGIVNMIIQLGVEQIKNFVAAMVWFLYWAPQGAAIGVWFLVAYVSYLTGDHLAKKLAFQTS